MSNTPNEWTLEGFVEHFDFFHHKMLDHKFVWVLGAGASLASGIPLGSELVDRWLSELHLREDGEKMPLEDWATAENLRIARFTYEDRASFYPKLYERRFREYPDEGYAYLESVMANADPSPGYSILAAALAGNPPKQPPRHNAVVTTNFDNLVADALSIYTDTFPFVCGHESLAPFVKVAMRRPVVCKIHRDLLLAPQNDSRSLGRLHDAWGMALRALFEHYTPLFIGYGGNDDTLMDLLDSLHPGDIKGRMVWCYHEDGKPSKRIVNLVAYHQGILVPTPDFDLLMVLLGEKMGIGLLDEEIGRRANARTERYRDRIQRFDTVGHPEVTKALAATLERSGGWWVWESKARSEVDPQRREVVYRQGIQHCPDSAPLHCIFANFMTAVRGNHDDAERLYRKSIELDPKNATNTGNFANFMTDVRGNHDEAERLYRKALKLNPKDAIHIGNYANFMTVVRGDHDEAERLYRKAIELDRQQVIHIRNFALFMTSVRADHDEAERLYRNALELDPKDAETTSSLASFMEDIQGSHDEAERLYRKAIELDPKNVSKTGSFAIFMSNIQGSHDKAERLYRKAIELDPTNANTTGNYAAFLLGQGRLGEAAPRLNEAKALNDGKKNQLAAEIVLHLAILAGVTKKDHTHEIEELCNLLSDGFPRGSWNFENVLGYAQENVAPEDHALYSALAEAILDTEKVPAALGLLEQRSATGAVSGDGKAKSQKRTAKITARKAAKKRSNSKKTRGKKLRKRAKTTRDR